VVGEGGRLSHTLFPDLSFVSRNLAEEPSPQAAHRRGPALHRESPKTRRQRADADMALRDAPTSSAGLFCRMLTKLSKLSRRLCWKAVRRWKATSTVTSI